MRPRSLSLPPRPVASAAAPPVRPRAPFAASRAAGDLATTDAQLARAARFGHNFGPHLAPPPLPPAALQVVPYVGPGAVVPHGGGGAAAGPGPIRVAPAVAAAQRRILRQQIRNLHPDRGAADGDRIRDLLAQFAALHPANLQQAPAPPAAQGPPLAILPPPGIAPVPHLLPPPGGVLPPVHALPPPPVHAPPPPVHVVPPGGPGGPGAPGLGPPGPPGHGAPAPLPGGAAPAPPGPHLLPPATFGSSVGEMLDRWAPSPGVTDPNVLQLLGTVTGSGNPLPGSVLSNGPATTAIGGASALGSGMQFAGSVYGIGRSAHTLWNSQDARERKAAGVDLGESVVNTVGSGSSAASSGIGLAGSSASHAASVAGGVLGGVSGFAGAGIGSWWLAKHGRRAVASARRYRALGQVQGAPIPAPPGAVPGAALLAHAPLTANAAAFRDYARRKNRNQTIRAGLGALSGGLGAAAGAAGIAALFGATAATPVGWGLAAAAAGVGLGLGAWKLGQWARRKYQTARHANLGRWDSFKAIFTRGKTSLQNQALAAGMTAAQNPFGQAEHHANWLLGSLNRGEQEGQDLRDALQLNHPGFHAATPAEKLKLIKHRLRSSG